MKISTLDGLRKSGRIIFECVSGSFLYNLNIETSDKDIRGIYINPPDEYLGLEEPEPQIQDDKHDVVYYSLKRFFELIQTANPNLIELLFIPKELSTIWTPVWQKLYDNRHLFITKKAYYTHAAYAEAQIVKCRGSNKKVHNPKPEKMPCKEDFCWVIDMNDISNYTIGYRDMLRSALLHIDVDFESKFANHYGFPFRPIPLKDSGIKLSEIHVSSLEHVPNVFRMYYYDEGAKGVFRGDQMLCCESIPKDDEITCFRGLLIYNKSEFDKELKDWHSYYDWKKNRNEARWIDQEKGLLTYDQKNVCHCYRLILSCENILRYGYPIVRFEGEIREFLMKIRRGEFTYEEIMEKVEEKRKLLSELLKTSSLPDNVNMEEIDALYRNLSKEK